MPTALFNCDETAYYAIRSSRIGYSVPDAFCFGLTTSLCRICEPAITTVEVNMPEMAKMAEMLIKINCKEYVQGSV